jgi:ribonuclease M5
MYTVKEAIIVEGRYDKIKLSSFIDSVIITTNGFTVIKNKKLIDSIKTLAKKTGVVILTDSDSAGFKIRNFIKQSIVQGTVLHAYIPEVKGKERRKQNPGKEGILGVEGIDEKTILKSLINAGCTINGENNLEKRQKIVTKADMFKMGLSGGAKSAERRRKMAKMLGIPAKISSNMLLDVINRLMTYDEFYKAAQNLDESD